MSSSNAVTIFSSRYKPILPEGALSYWSIIIVCLLTFRKYPLIKYTPSEIVHADPIDVAFNGIAVANGFVAIIRELPYSISESGTIKFSPSVNSVVVKSSPALEYFT